MVDNNLQSYADLYKGAVTNLYEKIPGYVRFVAHAVRDLTNGMAACKLGRDRQQVQYVQLVGDLLQVWEVHGLPKGSETLTVSDVGAAPTPALTLTVPGKVVTQIQTLLREHEAGRSRKNESPYLFFEAFLPNATGRDALPDAYPDLWKNLKDWFTAQCHEGGHSPDTDVVGKIEGKFEQLEVILLSVADRYTNTINKVDEILEEANS